MDLRQKVYQMFLLGTSGDGYLQALENNLGGVIFFTDDIETSEQFSNLIKNIKSISLTHPFLSIDQEGGRVERTQNIHSGKKYLSAQYAYQKGLEFLEQQTKEIASELSDFGINLNFAPCVDVNTNPLNPIIGERAFSNCPDEVIEAGALVSKTYQENNILTCLKHFPGHGDASADSHLELPKIDLTLKQMENIHIKPFAKLCKNADMVMVAHLYCTCFENEILPTSLSKNAIDYLQQNLGFDGVVVSDDMIMQGVAGFDAVQACEKAIKAGVNLLIYRNSQPETIEIIEQIATNAIKDAELRHCIEKSFEIITKLKTNKAFKR